MPSRDELLGEISREQSRLADLRAQVEASGGASFQAVSSRRRA
jgi:hypothetical protein